VCLESEMKGQGQFLRKESPIKEAVPGRNTKGVFQSQIEGGHIGQSIPKKEIRLQEPSVEIKSDIYVWTDKRGKNRG